MKRRLARPLGAFALVGATYCMVAGGPYGLEEVVAGCGYGRALLLLAVLPLVWALPTTLMISELASALPEDGGYYVWVERAFGRFWGFQEAWLSLAASVFDMALYPTLFALYVQRLSPALAGEKTAVLLGLAVIVLCTAWNVLGARPVGDASVASTVLTLLPFGLLVLLGAGRTGAVRPGGGSANLLGGVLIAMWNYMGWDNASTVAGEVERPRRAYPAAMAGALALVVVTYILPVAATARTGIDPRSWTTGAWADVGRTLGGPGLAVAIVAGGAVSAFAMFNALVLSYSRVPAALADDGMLPRAFGRRSAAGSPVVSIVVCAAAWALCLALGFDRLIELDVLLYGGSLALEFAALAALRIREPELPRPFRIPGGTAAAIALGVGPVALLAVAFVANAGEKVGPVPSLALAAVIAAAGPALYLAARLRRA